MANGRVSGPVVATSATGEQLAMGQGGPPGPAGPPGPQGPAGAGGSGLAIAEVQGTSTVAGQPGVTYEVTTTAGTPGPVTINTTAMATATPNPGATIGIVRTDGSGNSITLNAPPGGTAQDPTTGAFASSVQVPTQNQALRWYINGNVLRLAP